MRLWLDGQCLQTSSRLRGIGRYVIELIRSIAEVHADIELVISFNGQMLTEAVDARELVARWIKPSNIHVWHAVVDGPESSMGYSDRRQLSEAALLHHVACLDVDIALSTSPFEGGGDIAAPLLPTQNSPVPIAAIFYDAIPLRFREKYLPGKQAQAFYQRRLTSLQHSVLNLCISDFSSSESKDLLPKVPVANIMAGVSPDFLAHLSTEKDEGFLVSEMPFALYVGGLDWRKNVSLIVEAFGKLDKTLADKCAFVLAGDHPLPLLEELRASWVRLGLADERLLFLGHLSDQRLVSVYRQARVVVQPSHMEGFGLTALEAIVAGVPVVASRTGALPEVVGDEGATFDPRDSAALAKLLAPLLSDPNRAQTLAERQKSRASAFSWKHSAELAEQALKGAIAKTSGQRAVGLTSIRRGSLARYRAKTLPGKLVAATFAAAEPMVGSPRRLLIDATQTARIDAGTGIQRVVKLITNNLLAPTSQNIAERLVIGCHEGESWYRLDRGEGSQFRIPDPTRRNYVRFSPNDVVLMLDSSWEFHAAHHRSLMNARLRGAEVISCLYDLVPLMAPAFCDPGMPTVFSQWFQTALNHSSGFVCISQAVADELLGVLSAINYPRALKIGFWKLGADFAAASQSQMVISQRVEAPVTFLMVGTLEPRKGHMVALRAMEMLWASGEDARLIIVGRLGWGVEHLAATLKSHPEFGERLIWRDGVGDLELRKLYDESSALIAASFAEGFGLPIVEAGRFNKPVIASDIPVFREVSAGSPHAMFFEVGSSEQLYRQLTRFTQAAGKLESDGARSAAAQSWPTWRESAAELEDILLGERWYKIYEPSRAAALDEPRSIGEVEAKFEIPEDEQKYEIDVIGPPEPSGKGGASFLVRLKNTSNITWSSVGGDRYCLKVAALIMSPYASGAAVGALPTRLPLVLPPDSSCFLKLEVAREAVRRGGTTVEFVVGQGSSWWKKRVSMQFPNLSFRL